MKNMPTGSAAKRPKKYMYAELLYFLDPIICNRRDSEGNYVEVFEDSNTSQPQLDSVNDPFDNDEPEESPVSRIPPVVKNKKKKDVPSQILNLLQQNQKNKALSSNTDEDDDTKFLLSFRNYMRKMSTEQKIDFKLEMLQVVKRIMRNDPSPLQSPLKLYSDNSSASFPSTRSFRSSTSVPQSSPLYFDNSPTNPTFVQSSQKNKYVTVPQSSPVLFSSASSVNLSPQQQSVPRSSTSQPSVIIQSISNVQPTQHSPIPEYPVYHIPETNNIQRTEDIQAAQFLVLQSQQTEDSDENIHKYLKLK